MFLRLFLLTPLREGRPDRHELRGRAEEISTHAPAGGATRRRLPSGVHRLISTHAPAGGATTWRAALRTLPVYFYSRPCGRGDIPQLHPSTQHHAFLLTPLREGRPAALHVLVCPFVISTHAPAGGATPVSHTEGEAIALFLLTPLREGRLELDVLALCLVDFYSRPCGRGDFSQSPVGPPGVISTHAPAGGATKPYFLINLIFSLFLLTPLREGRPAAGRDRKKNGRDFYSRPCGRGDEAARRRINERIEFLLTPLREGRRGTITGIPTGGTISTHAPAGGATRRGLADRP